MYAGPLLAAKLKVDGTAPPCEPVVSVCIVNWNCCELLRRCLTSLYTQPQGLTFETIVVDNASVDGAADMVAVEFPQVRLFRNASNLGFSKGNNQAAKHARGSYFFFLNNDTEVPAFLLKHFTDFAEEHPNVGMLGPRLRGADGQLQINFRTRPTLHAMLHRISFLRWTGLFRRAYYRYRRDTFDTPDLSHNLRVEVLMGAAVFLPRTAFEASGRWDERYRFGGEDLDLSTQVSRRYDVVHFGQAEVLHYGRVSSRANVAFSAPNVAVGYVHYFRTAGVSHAALLIYKCLVTVDAPIQVACKYAQYAVRSLLGRSAKAAKSKLAARGLARFLTHELPAFWRA